jgi:hypothetical protein
MATVPTHNDSNIIVVHSIVATARHCTNLLALVVGSFALSLQIEVAQKETIIYQSTFTILVVIKSFSINLLFSQDQGGGGWGCKS